MYPQIQKEEIYKRVNSVKSICEKQPPFIEVTERTIYQYLVSINLIDSVIYDNIYNEIRKAFSDIATTTFSIQAKQNGNLLISFHIR